MSSDFLSQLDVIRRRAAGRYLASGDWAAALDAMGEITTPEQRGSAVKCHYELSKAEAAMGNWDSARAHASAVERLREGGKALRFLNAQRIRLLADGRPSAATAASFAPGIVRVSGIGSVPVLGRYEARGRSGPLTEVIRLLKKAPEELTDAEQGARLEVIRRVAQQLCALLRDAGMLGNVDLLVPIPPDAERYAVRGYHPPEAIAKAMALETAIPLVANALVATRATRSVRGLAAHERQPEIAGSMGIHPDRAFIIEGAKALLVDDVVTLGTHFNEAKRVLEGGGAVAVTATAITTARGRPVPLTG